MGLLENWKLCLTLKEEEPKPYFNQWESVDLHHVVDVPVPGWVRVRVRVGVRVRVEVRVRVRVRIRVGVRVWVGVRV